MLSVGISSGPVNDCGMLHPGSTVLSFSCREVSGPATLTPLKSCRYNAVWDLSGCVALHGGGRFREADSCMNEDTDQDGNRKLNRPGICVISERSETRVLGLSRTLTDTCLVPLGVP